MNQRPWYVPELRKMSHPSGKWPENVSCPDCPNCPEPEPCREAAEKMGPDRFASAGKAIEEPTP
jgi:hypothetical protein